MASTRAVLNAWPSSAPPPTAAALLADAEYTRLEALQQMRFVWTQLQEIVSLCIPPGDYGAESNADEMQVRSHRPPSLFHTQPRGSRRALLTGSLPYPAHGLLCRHGQLAASEARHLDWLLQLESVDEGTGRRQQLDILATARSATYAGITGYSKVRPGCGCARPPF